MNERAIRGPLEPVAKGSLWHPKEQGSLGNRVHGFADPRIVRRQLLHAVERVSRLSTYRGHPKPRIQGRTYVWILAPATDTQGETALGRARTSPQAELPLIASISPSSRM